MKYFKKFKRELFYNKNHNIENNTQDNTKTTESVNNESNKQITFYEWLSKNTTFYFDFYGQTVLYTACIDGNLNIMKKLLSIPDMQKYINIENGYGNTPLIEAVKAEDINLTHLLLENGANPQYIPLNDIYSWTALHEACYLNDSDMIHKT
jgi:ankyrin repeat protein